MASADDLSSRYQRHDMRTHIYTLPDTWAGSAVPQTATTFVLSDDGGERMVKRDVCYVPALLKCFDEVLVNATDHAVRLRSDKRDDVKPVRNIQIDVDAATGRIVVYNDGDGLDVELHPEHRMHVPALVFGELLTSGNYNEAEERVVGGKNGVGAKLANIFSTEFVVETLDHRRHRLFKQRWHSNMAQHDEPVVKASALKTPFTRISWTPDYARFGLAGLTPDLFALIQRRAFDAAACTDAAVTVTFNGKKLPVKSLSQYAALFLPEDAQRVHELGGTPERPWEVVAALAPGDAFEQVSFVNGVNTLRGGKHVDYIVGQVAKKATEAAAAKKKELKIANVRDNLFLFVRATVVNPTFDSQSKETLTTLQSKFGAKCDLSDKFCDKLLKLGLLERATSLADFHDRKRAAKTDGRKTSRVHVPKLDDANLAGTKHSAECTLILTEGDSAKAMAIAGLAVIGRDHWGVFPLRGKILNVRDAPPGKIADNEEVSALKKILGLETGRRYDDASSLRYGRICILSDQDSVTGDTPLLLRDAEGQMHVRTIDDIAETGWAPGDAGSTKEYAKTSFTVWTERGWTPIVHVMRHRCEKRIFRVLTHTGVVDVTEDHSMLRPDATEVAPSSLKIGEQLLHSFPVFQEHLPPIPDNLYALPKKPDLEKLASMCKIQYYQLKSKQELIEELDAIRSTPCLERPVPICAISEDEAYAMGLFWADGSCGVYEWPYTFRNKDRPREYTFARTSISWNISNTNLDFLNRAKECMEKRYAFEFKIIPDRHSATRVDADCQPSYKLIVNGGEKTRCLVEWYRQMFYDEHAKKRVPMEILNAPETVRKRFFDGFYDGDGSKGKSGAMTFDVDGKIGAMGMFYLSKSLGYQVSLNIRTDKPKVYSLNLTPKDGHQQAHPHMIKKIVDMGVTDQYVYDLETENHHFQAGVGQLIVHNTDGYHIRGLLMNVFAAEWPSLFKLPGFLTSMLTPTVKATKGAQKLEFYSLNNFEAWRAAREAEPDGLRGWHIKYYKGLGTSTAAEAKEYFKALRLTTYVHRDPDSDRALAKAFDKKLADARKTWLGDYDRARTLDYAAATEVPFEDFVDKELIHFSNYDVERSINHLMDGLKPSTRKILYACFKRNLRSEIKVAQLAGYVSEHTGYHHGEASLQAAIVGMAQDFVGANNVALLVPNGQFGTRIKGGSDAASPRYIFTLLTPLARALFRADDFAVLERALDDDGAAVEPLFYVPVAPLVLMNGACGIGTGFATSLPSYCPDDVVAACRALIAAASASPGIEDSDELLGAAMDAVPLPSLAPWYLGFRGTIEPLAGKPGAFASRGRWTWLDDATLEITELPVGVWTDDYKEFLDKAVQDGKFRAVQHHYTDRAVRFVVSFEAGARASLGPKIESELRLVAAKGLSCTNVHLFGATGAIRKFDGPDAILRAWARVRFATYRKRKAHLLDALEKRARLLDAKVAFIAGVIDGSIAVANAPTAAVEATLQAHGFPRLSGGEGDEGYGYLLRLPISSLTVERKLKHEEEAVAVRCELIELRATSLAALWQRELTEFEEAWTAHRRAREAEQEREAQQAAEGGGGGGPRKRARK